MDNIFKKIDRTEVTKKVDFEEVVCIMNMASIKKLYNCIASVEWSAESVSTALSNIGISNSRFMTHQDGSLELISFSGIVSFTANEVPGIIVPFACYVEAEVTYDLIAEKYELHTFFGPKEMRGGKDYEISYNVEWLYYLFYSHNAEFDISQFVSEEFNFQHLCKLFKCKNGLIDTVSVPFEED